MRTNTTTVKQTRNSFQYFKKHFQDTCSLGQLSASNLAKEAGKKWQSMTVEERQPYIGMTKLDKERYDQEKLGFE
jgi:hypothetical protein